MPEKQLFTVILLITHMNNPRGPQQSFIIILLKFVTTFLNMTEVVHYTGYNLY